MNEVVIRIVDTSIVNVASVNESTNQIISIEEYLIDDEPKIDIVKLNNKKYIINDLIIKSFDDYDKLIDDHNNILIQIINDCTDLKWLYSLQELDDYINTYYRLPNYNDSLILYEFIINQELENTNFNYWNYYKQKYKYLFTMV